MCLTILRCVHGKKENPVTLLREDGENKHRQGKRTRSDTCDHWLYCSSRDLVSFTNVCKGSGDLAEYEKSTVMLKAVLGIAPCSVSALPDCRRAFSYSCNLHPAQRHAVVA